MNQVCDTDYLAQRTVTLFFIADERATHMVWNESKQTWIDSASDFVPLFTQEQRDTMTLPEHGMWFEYPVLRRAILPTQF